MLTLISATLSPFARINRIAMHEKGIEFELKSEVPWDSTTETPKYNPLEKLPILLVDDGRAPVYDSAHIQEYIIQKYADRGPSLLVGNVDDDLQARQIQTLAEGLMDAYVLIYWEEARAVPSPAWLARQYRKLDGALKACEELAQNRRPPNSDFLLGDTLTIADIAVCAALGRLDFFETMRPRWQADHPHLAAYWQTLDQGRESFRRTRPVMFEITDTVV